MRKIAVAQHNCAVASGCGRECFTSVKLQFHFNDKSKGYFLTLFFLFGECRLIHDSILYLDFKNNGRSEQRSKEKKKQIHNLVTLTITTKLNKWLYRFRSEMLYTNIQGENARIEFFLKHLNDVLNIKVGGR